MKVVGKNAGILRCALNDNEGHTLLWPSCYLASEMMEGENVKASTPIFQTTTTQGSAFCPILHRVLVLPK